MPHHPLYTEKELVTRIAGGDNEAFDVLFHQYWDHVYSVALIMTKSPVMADDIGQEVFLSLLENRDALAAVENLNGYLYTHVKFRVHKRLRRIRVEEAYRLYLSSKVPSVSSSDQDSDLRLKELKNGINKGVELLPLQQQRAFQLSRQQGMTHEQIAREMNISPKTVKDYIVRAIAFLKKYLIEQGLLAGLFLFFEIFGKKF